MPAASGLNTSRHFLPSLINKSCSPYSSSRRHPRAIKSVSIRSKQAMLEWRLPSRPASPCARRARPGVSTLRVRAPAATSLLPPAPTTWPPRSGFDGFAATTQIVTQATQPTKGTPRWRKTGRKEGAGGRSNEDFDSTHEVAGRTIKRRLGQRTSRERCKSDDCSSPASRARNAAVCSQSMTSALHSAKFEDGCPALARLLHQAR